MKAYKYLICISSFKRPLYLLGQIHRFYNQTYKNLDLSVVVRGCDINVYNLIKEECKIYPNLYINYDNNKDQLNNLLDCVRQTNHSQYDFFCKIDDDDLYSLSYIENINTVLNKYKQNIIGFRNRHNLQLIGDENNIIKFTKSINYLYGNTLGFSQYIFEILNEISQNISEIEHICKKYNFQLQNPSQFITNKFREDKLIDHTMAGLVGEDRIYVDTKLPNQLYYCRLTKSVTGI